MVIAIEKGLTEIKNQLEMRGYETFYIGERPVADAIIYKNRNSHPYFQVNSTPITSLVSSKVMDSKGALLINAENKSIEDILEILKNRTYSPLFYTEY